MGLTYTYLVLLGILLVVFLFFFFYMLKNKNSLSLNFAVFALFNAIYVLGLFGQILSSSEDMAFFFYRLKSYGALFLAPLFVLFLYRFSNILNVNKKYSFALFIIPFLLLIVITTNEYHHLYYKELNVLVKNGFMFVENVRGPLYYASHIYNLFMFVMALYFLRLIPLRKNYSFKRFSKFLSVYVALSLIFQLIHITAVIPHNVDLIPLASVFGIVVYIFAVFYCNIFNVYELNFNLMPELSDGIIITDKKDEVIYYNAVAERLLPWVDADTIGKTFESLPFEQFKLKNDLNGSYILENTYANLTKYYLFKKIQLEHKNKHSAFAYVFKDHTENVYLQTRLEFLATRDGLTKIYNQISILNKGKEGYEDAKLNKRMFSITLMDVDNFKVVNDKFGHIFGNSVLIEIADNIGETFKGSCCYYGRFGGDEFLIVCRDCKKEHQQEKMDKLLKSISKIKYNELKDVELSISAGTHFIDFSVEGDYPTYEEAIELADKKMYEAKDLKKETKER